MNRDSNIYTFLFVGIMVIGIASILAFTSQTLKPMQKENVKNEKMQNILSTVGINVSRDEAKDLYSKYITQELALKIDGTVNENINPFSDLNLAKELKKDYNDYYKILTEIKVRFQFIDQNVILEDWAEMIKLDEFGEFKQVRFSPRLDFVPLMDKEKLELYYSARKKISELYNSDKLRIEFKLLSGDLLMMDNYRLLHGRTSYDTSQGNRFLQGCYIDYDSTEGKLRHLKRKFNL